MLAMYLLLSPICLLIFASMVALIEPMLCTQSHSSAEHD